MLPVKRRATDDGEKGKRPKGAPWRTRTLQNGSQHQPSREGPAPERGPVANASAPKKRQPEPGSISHESARSPADGLGRWAKHTQQQNQTQREASYLHRTHAKQSQGQAGRQATRNVRARPRALHSKAKQNTATAAVRRQQRKRQQRKQHQGDRPPRRYYRTK